MQTIIGTKEAAQRLGVTQQHVRDLCREGVLEATKIGARAWAIDAASVEALRARREEGKL
jgi:excisionase family DNA binding protein